MRRMVSHRFAKPAPEMTWGFDSLSFRLRRPKWNVGLVFSIFSDCSIELLFSASADNVRNNVELIVQYVYILRCNNGHPYVGCTDNLKERLERHKNGYVPATKELRPIKLIWYGCFEDKYLAFNFEKYLKTCSGRVLINKRLITDSTKPKAK